MASKPSVTAHVAFAQFLGCTFLSAILDNNVVADFASRALLGLRYHRFCTCSPWRRSQATRWAVAGPTSARAQSVVAYAFIQRDVDEHYTPVQWIKEMTPVIVQILVVLAIIIYLESALLDWLY